MMLDVNRQRLLFKAFIAVMILAILPWTSGWFASIFSWQPVVGINILMLVAIGTIPLLWQYHRREL